MTFAISSILTNLPSNSHSAVLDPAKQTYAHCSYLYVSSALFIVLTGDMLKLCECLLGCRGWACRALGSQCCCWEVTAFLFRHTLQGTLLSLPNSLNTIANTHTNIHVLLRHVLLITSQRRGRELEYTQQDRAWLQAEGVDLAVNQHRSRQMLHTCCSSKQETNLHKLRWKKFSYLLSNIKSCRDCYSQNTITFVFVWDFKGMWTSELVWCLIKAR